MSPCGVTALQLGNSKRPVVIYMRPWTKSSLCRVNVYRTYGNKHLLGTITTHPREQISGKVELKNFPVLFCYAGTYMKRLPCQESDVVTYSGWQGVELQMRRNRQLYRGVATDWIVSRKLLKISRKMNKMCRINRERNNNVIMTSKRRRDVVLTSRWRFHVIMKLLLRRASAGNVL